MTTDSSNYEDSIRDVISAMYVKNNVLFMDAVVLQLAKTLKADHVFIGELQKEKFSVKTLSHCMDNKIVDGFEYMLKNSPCDVVYEGKVAIYPKNVTNIFPLDQYLIDLKIEGYAGIPLFNNKQETFGAIMALYRNPIENSDFFSSIMTLFANQVANEMEKQHYIEEIENLNKTLESKVEKAIKKNKEQQKQLYEQSKMVSMGEMIGNIAHQWRQPLNVLGISNMTLDAYYKNGMIDDKFMKKHIKSSSNTLEYLSNTIDDFRDFIKDDRIKIEFTLSNMINSFINLVEGTIKNANINMILDLKKDTTIDGYKNELIQCLINIFNNAKDMQIEKGINDKFIFISTSLDKNKAIIKIKDNAGGIPNDIINKIYEPYFTTKFKSQGTGLGLSMTYNLIVNGMGGTIEAINKTYKYKDKEYAGAEFAISLPIK